MLELKELAVKRVKDGLATWVVTKKRGLVEQSPHNQFKAIVAGKRAGLAPTRQAMKRWSSHQCAPHHIRLRYEIDCKKAAVGSRGD